jgi:hypothetical protein
MIANDHIRFGRGASGKGPARLAPRPTTYLTTTSSERWYLTCLAHTASGPFGSRSSAICPLSSSTLGRCRRCASVAIAPTDCHKALNAADEGTCLGPCGLPASPLRRFGLRGASKSRRRAAACSSGGRHRQASARIRVHPGSAAERGWRQRRRRPWGPDRSVAARATFPAGTFPRYPGLRFPG